MLGCTNIEVYGCTAIHVYIHALQTILQSIVTGTKENVRMVSIVEKGQWKQV